MEWLYNIMLDMILLEEKKERWTFCLWYFLYEKKFLSTDMVIATLGSNLDSESKLSSDESQSGI